MPAARTTPPTGHLLLASAHAGSAQDGAVGAARRVLASAGPVEVATTATVDELDRALASSAGRRLVVAGGDGSVHLVVSRLRAAGRLADEPLGLVPLGTGNDLARSLGLPLEPGPAAERVRDGAPARLDLLVDDEGAVVVNAVHLGAGADAAAAAARLKDRLGALAYPAGALATGLRAPGRRVRVEVDGRVLADRHRRTLLVGIGNGATIGGGTALLPGARLDDGRLDVVVSYAAGPLARARFGAALARGEHLGDRDVRHGRGRTVTVRGELGGLDTDGELDDRDPARTARTWTVAPGAWSVLV